MKAKKQLSMVLLLMAALAASFTVTGCRNTAQGAGQDIERMGEKIQDKTD